MAGVTVGVLAVDDASEIHRALGQIEGKLGAIGDALDAAREQRLKQDVDLHLLTQKVDSIDKEWSALKNRARGVMLVFGTTSLGVGGAGAWLIMQLDRVRAWLNG